MYGLYVFDKSNKLQSIEIENEYYLDKYKPTLFKLSHPNEYIDIKTKLIRLYFIILSMGNLELYCIKNEEGVVHVSYVITGGLSGFKFRFMKNIDIEIGPCYTVNKHRGKNIYPYCLQNILKDKLNEKNNAYMIIDNENYSSINGVKKINFIKCGDLIKTKWLKKYLLKNKEVSNDRL